MNSESYFLAKDLNNSGKKRTVSHYWRTINLHSNRTYRCKDAVTSLLEQTYFVVVIIQNVFNLVIFSIILKQFSTFQVLQVGQTISVEEYLLRVLQKIHKTKSAECMRQLKIPTY